MSAFVLELLLRTTAEALLARSATASNVFNMHSKFRLMTRRTRRALAGNGRTANLASVRT